ncbi:MAG: hypothetical protein DRJ28_08620 [Actinobacteria bacterium]|nr:MAG: hypothetical protein DRJ28_08620 [Actinomycetota bacterium]
MRRRAPRHLNRRCRSAWSHPDRLRVQDRHRRPDSVRVIIYTRQACPLCEKGIAAARSVFGGNQITLVDVDLDIGLMERYTDRVPVIETEDGEIIDEGIISESMLRAFAS